jgi:hypothetical protein
MTKRTHRFMASASLGARLAALMATAALAAACSSGSGGTSGSGGAGGATTSSTSSAGGAGGEATTTTTTTASGGPIQGCKADADCAAEVKAHLCDTSTGDCVECLPGTTKCADGKYCSAATNTCEIGCSTTSDCNPSGSGNLLCDPTSHSCVGCTADTDCPLGAICAPNQKCVAGCTVTHGCPQPPGAEETCCNDSCYNMHTDPNHCGACGKQCEGFTNAAPKCSDSTCGLGKCELAYANCDGDPTNGCEWNILQDGPCTCKPMDTQSCYQGAPGTLGIGVCAAGKRTCNEGGTAWGPCIGQVLPAPEICANNADEDCNGKIDDVTDVDGDGWTACNGDCCEVPGPGCASPKLVNPGAFEVLDNYQDDDCDPTTVDNKPVLCSAGENFTGVTAFDVAAAMDICQKTTANTPLPQKKWGLLNATQLLANGAVPSAAVLADIQNKQTAILVNYGIGGIVPRFGATMAGISSGVMRDQTDPGYAGTSTSLNRTGAPPAAYLSANANALPASSGCNGACQAGSGANDSVNIRLQIRVPSNARGFSYDFRFLSSEYWTFQCTQYNDFFLALLQSTAMGLPADKNISFDVDKVTMKKSPISVNNSFFDVCIPKGCNACASGAAALAGTGLQLNNTGGSTAWLTTDAPVNPGETVQIELMIFDVSDNVLDSVALLDNFRWSLKTLDVRTGNDR